MVIGAVALPVCERVGPVAEHPQGGSRHCPDRRDRQHLTVTRPEPVTEHSPGAPAARAGPARATRSYTRSKCFPAPNHRTPAKQKPRVSRALLRMGDAGLEPATSALSNRSGEQTTPANAPERPCLLGFQATTSASVGRCPSSFVGRVWEAVRGDRPQKKSWVNYTAPTRSRPAARRASLVSQATRVRLL